jgi:hypothetical protein
MMGLFLTPRESARMEHLPTCIVTQGLFHGSRHMNLFFFFHVIDQVIFTKFL